jgi:hypothetical protein
MTWISCFHCGGIHLGMCPRIKCIEYYPDGVIKRVEYHNGQEQLLCHRCGHSKAEHSGHTHAVGTPEPTHCSQGDGCLSFSDGPVKVMP